MTDQQVCPVGTIASLLDVTERRVNQLVNEGIIPKTDRGRYELFPVIKGYIKYLRERKFGEAVVSLDEARQRKLAAEAALAEIELAKARADVVRVEDVTRQWELILGDVRTRFLALPTKLAPMVAVEDAQKVIEEMIADGVHTALGQLAEGIPDDAGSEAEPTPGAEIEPRKIGAAAKNNDKRVGRPRKKIVAGS